MFENDNATRIRFIRSRTYTETKKNCDAINRTRNNCCRPITPDEMYEYSDRLSSLIPLSTENTVTFSEIDKSTGMDRFRSEARRRFCVVRQKAIDHAPVKTYASCHVLGDTRPRTTNIDAREA